MNETIELINKRVSVRRFLKRKLEKENTNIIISSALRAPTARNLMLYSIIEVEDQKVKDRLGKTCNHTWISKAPYILLFTADMQRWYDFYKVHDVESTCARNNEEFVKPDLSNLMMSCCDAIIAAHSAVIAAESLGIGSCYIGDIMGNYEVHSDMFDLPRCAFPITMVCFGYPEQSGSKTTAPRFSKEYIVHKNKYRHLSPDDFSRMLERMDGWFNDMKEKRGMNPGECMYDSLALGGPELEEKRSVRIAVERWLS